ncbi:MAG: 5-phospho-D-xylono,4-lactonase [Pseudonocardiales bacterium]|nr:5-phospho-D-xylono,4-lactonase [Pseudonocardiales bacterium]
MTGPAAPGAVRTVLGDIPADDLGACDYHEHLFQASPLLAGDELDDPEASGVEAALLRSAGIRALVEATPIGLGRNPEAVARISAATGLQVVHVTGAHRQEHYADGHWILGESEQALVARFRAEVQDGMTVRDTDRATDRTVVSTSRSAPVPEAQAARQRPYALGEPAHARDPDGNPIRAGALKAGIGYWRISPFEGRVLTAVAVTAALTGAAVMVHLEFCSAAFEVLQRLTEHGLSADRIVLAHVDRNPDPGLHLELASQGCYLGYDGMARHRSAPDSALLDCIGLVVAGGRADRVVLGGDVARRSRYIGYGGIPGLAYLPERFLPRLIDRIGPELSSVLLRDNPARLLGMRPSKA